MDRKEQIDNDCKKLIEARSEFLKYLDENIPKDCSGLVYDFSKDTKLDAKKVYELFYKLDYQGRKLRGHLVKDYGLKAE